MKEAKPWYAPSEIYFSKVTVLWLIQNLGTLKEGHWPPEASNYIDPGIISRSGSNRAPFTVPVEYAAEIELRLERAGVDGLILLAMECWGKSEQSISKHLNMPMWSVRKRYKSALAYVASGPAGRWITTKKRAGISYKDFKLRKR